MKTIGIIGAGSWGTALGATLTEKGHIVNMYGRNANQREDMRANHENRKYLPGVKLSENFHIVETAIEALEGADIALFAVPAQNFRKTFEDVKGSINDRTIVVNVAKGIERHSLMRLSEIAEEIKPGVKYVTLSGPSHAEEVGQGLPTTVAVASRNIELAEYIQDVFMTDRFRVYTNNDVCGTELGGALKNIIALGAGISDGIGFGDNAKAALMTRGITEMARLGIKVGADRETFSGLTGIGDLIVTCTSMHSRNRRCGIMIGEGMRPNEATEKIGMVVEGMFTTEAAYELAKKVGVEMPITECIYRCIKEEITARQAVELLMGRDRKNEVHL